MAHEIPTTEPTDVRAGESWKWDRSLSDHPPSDGWTLKYAVRGPTDHDITAAASGELYEVRVLPAATEGLTAGTYRLIGYIEKGSPVTDRQVVYDQPLTVRASPLDAVDEATYAERMVALLEAGLETLSTGRQLVSFSIHDRSVSYANTEEGRRALIQDLGYWRSQVWMERNPGKLGPRVEATFKAVS